MITGKGFYVHKIWTLAATPEIFVKQAQKANLGHVLIKIADGNVNYPLDAWNDDWETFTKDAIKLLKQAGILVGGWTFVYGAPSDVTSQGKKFAERLHHLDLGLGIINAEDFKASNGQRYTWDATSAKAFMKALTDELATLGIQDTLLGLNSSQFVQNSDTFPLDEFLEDCFVAMPRGQLDSETLLSNLSNYKATYSTKTIMPTAVINSTHTALDATNYLNKVAGANLMSGNFWSWGEALNNSLVWDAIATFSSDITTDPNPTIILNESDLNMHDDNKVTVYIDSHGHDDGLYANTDGSLTVFERGNHRFKWAHTRKDRSTVWAQWKPVIPESGRYRIEAFIPNQNGTTEYARYHVHGIIGTNPIAVIEVNQRQIRDNFTLIGEFELDARHPDCGKINMTNFIRATSEGAGEFIAFGPIRWTKLIPTQAGFADGFDSPVGTAQQRASSAIWPGDWIGTFRNEETFLRKQPVSDGGTFYYHTGVDLNLSSRNDHGEGVYSIADGTVLYSKKRSDGFGNTIVIKHDPYLEASGQIVTAYSRYAHLNERSVTANTRVARGTKIGTVGRTGTSGSHLHFDISISNTLDPKFGGSYGHWPPPATRTTREKMAELYTSPKDFISNRRP